MKKIIFQLRCKKHLIVFLVLALIILIVIQGKLDTAFEYKTNKPDMSKAYELADGKIITQDVGFSLGELRGVTIQFGTYQRVNKGTISVTFNEDGKPIRKEVFESENLIDSGYQEIYFNNPVRMEESSQYSLSISAEYEEKDNHIAVYTSTGGSGLFFGQNLENDRTLCYQLILTNYKLKNQMLIFCTILFIIVLALFILNLDIRNMNIGKAIIVLILLLLVLETINIDLFKNINTEVVIVPYTSSDKVHVIRPGETWESICGTECINFSNFEFYIEGEQTTDILIKVVDELTSKVYFDRKLNVDEIITDKMTGKPVISISNSLIESGNLDFPKGMYHIYFTNTSKDKDINLNVIEDSSGNQQVNVSLIKNTWLGHRIASLVIFIMVLYIAIVCALKDKKRFTVESFFLASVIPLSIIYFILILPWSAPDAGTHFLASYRFSNIILGNEPWYGRASDVGFYHNIWALENNPNMKGFSEIVYSLKRNIEDANLIAWPSPKEKMEYYSIFCYLPQILGLCLGRVLGLGSILTIYLARLFMMAVYVLACYNAVKKTPVGKFIFASIPLLPISLMYSSAISYDPLVLITTLNFLALTLRLYKEPESKKVVMECIVWIFLIGAIKGGGYLILIPIVFIVCNRKNLKIWAYIGAIIGSGIISVFMFDVVLPHGMELFQFGKEASGFFSASYAYSNPLKYMDMCLSTYLKYIDNLVITMCGTHLAWLENTIPIVIIMGIMLIIGIFSIYEKDLIEFRNKDKWIFSFVIFLELIATPVMLLSWTPLGSIVIEGLQGRYYLPILPLIIMIITKFKLHVGTEKISEDNRLEIQSSCYIIFTILSCISVYYMMRIYLLR